jgi:gluconolactonase
LFEAVPTPGIPQPEIFHIAMAHLRPLFPMIFAVSSFIACSPLKPTPELFKSSVIMAVNSSTEGVEGPAVDKSGTLYWVNYDHQGTIGMLPPSGKPAVFIELPDSSIGNGIRFDSNGNMLIADYTNHNILKVEMSSRTVTVFAHESGMSQPNDIAIDSRNRIYASDPDWKTGSGKIWRIDTSGKTTLLDSLGTANGIDVNPDETTLYVNASGNVFAYDLSANGEVSNKRILIGFSDGGMDGMRCDVKGNIYITRFGKGQVVKVSPEGKILKEIALTGKSPTNIAFGGTDGCTAYVTLQDQGNLESFRTDLPGREWEMQNRVKIK